MSRDARGEGTPGLDAWADADGEPYVVAVKPSARRASAAAGEWLRRHGPRRAFPTRALARRWARTLSTPGYTVWVQDADPRDPSDVDGYLLARRYAGDTSLDPAGEQLGLDRARTPPADAGTNGEG